MRWLLFTTIGANPGDEFARIGLIDIIRPLDPDATFRCIDKHTQAIANPPPCDAVVVCGMPLFWSFGVDRCHQEGWWGALVALANRVPTLLAGVGSFAPWSCPVQSMADARTLRREARRMWEACASFGWFRDWVAVNMTSVQAPVLPCPSVFAIAPHDRPRTLRLFNAMPDGAHYAQYNLREARRWADSVRQHSDRLRAAGFEFIAHHDSEHRLAVELGWPVESIHVSGRDPLNLLDLYARCDLYVGNRVHGAIVAAAAGARSLCIGYDSRLDAVHEAGGWACSPSQASGGIDRVLSSDEPRADVAPRIAAARASTTRLIAAFIKERL